MPAHRRGHARSEASALGARGAILRPTTRARWTPSIGGAPTTIGGGAYLCSSYGGRRHIHLEKTMQVKAGYLRIYTFSDRMAPRCRSLRRASEDRRGPPGAGGLLSPRRVKPAASQEEPNDLQQHFHDYQDHGEHGVSLRKLYRASARLRGRLSPVVLGAPGAGPWAPKSFRGRSYPQSVDKLADGQWISAGWRAFRRMAARTAARVQASRSRRATWRNRRRETRTRPAAV